MLERNRRMVSIKKKKYFSEYLHHEAMTLQFALKFGLFVNIHVQISIDVFL